MTHAEPNCCSIAQGACNRRREHHVTERIPSTAAALRTADDCWNQSGVRGDRSCPELRHHAHCRNCPVYSAAASRLLDVPLPAGHAQGWAQHFAQPVSSTTANSQPLLFFRVDTEWLALPIDRCVEITELRPIHTVPHRRSSAMLGIVNIRGTLLPCVTLSALLNAASERLQRDCVPRLIVLSGTSGPLAVRTNEVDGVYRVPTRELSPVPATVSKGRATHTRAVIARGAKMIALLDHELLYSTIVRSLS